VNLSVAEHTSLVEERNMTADFLVADYGSVVGFTPMTEKAKQATGKEGVIASEPWQWLDGNLMVDHRMSDDLIENLQNDGFSIEWNLFHSG
jgi:hypothetical protein